MEKATKECPECGHLFKGNGWDGAVFHLSLFPHTSNWLEILRPTLCRLPVASPRDPLRVQRRRQMEKRTQAGRTERLMLVVPVRFGFVR